MTSFNVKNGTNAGWRIIDEARTEPWTCGCGQQNKPNYINCVAVGCRERRP